MATVLSWEEVPKVFNVIFGRVMKALKLVEIGRNKYDSQAAVKIPQHKLEVCVACIDAILAVFAEFCFVNIPSCMSSSLSHSRFGRVMLPTLPSKKMASC